MKYMLIFASAMALAVASPHHRILVGPGAARPDPALVPEVEPIAIGPAVLDYEPIAVGPAIVEEQPAIPAPAPVLPEGILPPIAPAPVSNPLVQILVNTNGQQVSVHNNTKWIQILINYINGQQVSLHNNTSWFIKILLNVPADPVHIVDSAPEPVEIGPAIVPEPVEIGVPILPNPAVILPEELN